MKVYTMKNIDLTNEDGDEIHVDILFMEASNGDRVTILFHPGTGEEMLDDIDTSTMDALWECVIRVANHE